jgi:hypothetical protein
MKNLIFALALSAPMSSFGNFYDFETCADGFNPRNFVPGLTITQGDVSGFMVVGSTVNWSQTRNGFNCIGVASLAWSGTKSLYTDSLEDTMIEFPAKVGGITILSDRGSPDSPDPIRVMVLSRTASPGEYKILALQQKSDNATTIDGCTFNIALPEGFDVLILETVNENESWDNLTVFPIPAPPKTISGNMTLQNTVGAGGPGLEIINWYLNSPTATFTGTVSVSENGGGAYSLNIPAAAANGAYTLRFKGGTYLSSVYNVILNGNNLTRTVSLRNGDISQDGEVGPGDFEQVVSQFGGTGLADCDNDGEVGPSDFEIVVGNYGLQDQ